MYSHPSTALAVSVSALVMGLVLSQEGSGSLPAGHEEILAYPYADSFSCEGQAYGYYADVDSGCQVFHICLPIEDNEGQVIETAKWSFFCGNATVFDQQTLTCNFPEDAFPVKSHPACTGRGVWQDRLRLLNYEHMMNKNKKDNYSTTRTSHN
eukprot:TRINITY_DN1220_c0_g2_i2.p1 TRINITY_DN1220_c0_g2~~TRINITY_DN1220_c0_g2_i2.p1  ORF type:complete len:153 (+),score=20.28 TRINITY_DN1220_c0_g2_i2:106-564(+)